MPLRRWAWAGIAFALLAAAGLRAGLIVHRYYDTDELEHLHAALLVAKGSLPFRDFFEHHGPLFWAGLAPVAGAPHDPLDKALAARVFVSMYWLGMLALVARPRRGTGAFEGLLAAACLAWFTAFAQKSLEIRPDVPAAFLALAAAALLPRRGRFVPAAAGALIGLALWCSLKAVFPAMGLAAALLVRRPKTGEAARALAGFAAGAGAVLALGAAYYAARGGLGELWACYVKYNGGFPGASAAWNLTLKPSLLGDPLLWAAGLLGMRRWRERPEEVGALGVSLAALAVTPSAYPQHLVFVAPFLASLAAKELVEIRGNRRRVFAGVLVGLSFVYPAAHSYKLIKYGNEKQIEAWNCVSDMLPNDAPVWDAWTGESFHRPHAAYLWFMPGDSQAYYQAQALESMYVSALAAPRTRGAIRCVSCLERLPKNITVAFDKYFEPSGCGRLWLRKRGV